ncbi:coiled-coil domain-containing protein [Helicobacter felis]|uniref:coiled-coil domain-containing protein n=1 Tax=Helicobacter felis TaxID=214 RepID=UPI0002E79A59|nr:hypothetical protein [Helicobacter felis]
MPHKNLAFGGSIEGGVLVLDRVVLVPSHLGTRFEGVKIVLGADAQGQDLTHALKNLESPQEFLTQLQTHFYFKEWRAYLDTCMPSKRISALQNAKNLPGLLGARPYPLWLLNPAKAQELSPDHICQSISQNMAKTLIRRFAPPLRAALVKMIATPQVCLIQVEGRLTHSLELVATAIKYHVNQQDKILLASPIAFKEALENKSISPHAPLSFCDLSTQKLEARYQDLETLQCQINHEPAPPNNLENFLRFLDTQMGDFVLPDALLEPIYHTLKEDLNALTPLKFRSLSLDMPAPDFSSALKAIYKNILDFEACDQEVAKIDFNALQEEHAKLTQEIQELENQKGRITDIESLEALKDQIRHKKQEQKSAFTLGKYAKLFGTSKLELIKDLLDTNKTRVARLKAHFNTTLRAQAQNFRPEPIETQPTECQILETKIQDLQTRIAHIESQKAQIQESLAQIQAKYNLESLEQIPSFLTARLNDCNQNLFTESTPLDTRLCFIPFGSDPCVLEMASPFDVVVILDEGGLNLDLLLLILNAQKVIWLKSTHAPNLIDLPKMPSPELQESLFTTCFANAPSEIKAQIHLKGSKSKMIWC